jgi:hypothetical protein
MIIHDFNINLAIEQKGGCAFQKNCNANTCYLLTDIYKDYPELEEKIANEFVYPYYGFSCYMEIVYFKAKYLKNHYMLDFLSLSEK